MEATHWIEPPTRIVADSSVIYSAPFYTKEIIMLKGLKELEKIKELDILYDYEMTESGEEYMLEQDIDLYIIEKELKALDIIKNKLLVGCFSKEDNYSNYAMAITMSGDETLKKNMMTEQEYNLLKEVLNDECGTDD